MKLVVSFFDRAFDRAELQARTTEGSEPRRMTLGESGVSGVLADAAAAAGGAEQWPGGGGKEGGAPKSGFVTVRPSGGSS